MICSALLETPIAMADESACAKKVFNQFCLGGSTDTLPPAEQYDEANSRFHYPDQVSVNTKSGQIISISKRLPPGRYIHFNDWKAKLIGLYGRTTDHSTLPPYARSRSSRLNAIRAGLGYMETRWEQKNWQILLRWANTDYIELRYQLPVVTTETATPTNTEGL